MANGDAQDLTDRVFLLRESLDEGRLKIAAHLWDGLVTSLQKIRVGEDGLVLPETVDGRIRALTTGLKYFRYREETKKAASLADIQQAYFRILELNFGSIRETMMKAGADPNAAGHVMARNPAFVADFVKKADAFIAQVREFWDAVGEAARFHIEDLECLKSVFGGDLFPSYTRNIASSAGLYVDTIILPCPILQSANLLALMKPEKLAYYMVKHAVNALAYKDLALADVNPPIVVVLPEVDRSDEYQTRTIKAASHPAVVQHASNLSGMDRKLSRASPPPHRGAHFVYEPKDALAKSVVHELFVAETYLEFRPFGLVHLRS